MPEALILSSFYSNEVTPHQARMNDVFRYTAQTEDAWEFDIFSIQCELNQSQPTPRSVPASSVSGKRRYYQSLKQLYREGGKYDIIHLTYLDEHVLPFILLAQQTPLVIGPNVGKYRHPTAFDSQIRALVFDIKGNTHYKSKLGNALMQGYLRLAMRRSDQTAYLGFSSWDVKTALVDRGIPRERTHRVPLGVPLDVFCPPTSEPEVSNEVLFIGRKPYRLKGFYLFITALKDVLRIYPEISVTIAGMESFPMSNHQLPDYVEDSVEFVGWVKRRELAEYYRRTDLYVHSSYTEAGSTTFAESLACGTPVVATDDSSFVEGKKGKNTLLFERGSATELRDAILEFYQNPRRYQTTARRFAMRYDIARTYDMLLSVYRSLLE